MRKIIALTAALLMLISVCSCSRTEENAGGEYSVSAPEKTEGGQGTEAEEETGYGTQADDGEIGVRGETGQEASLNKEDLTVTSEAYWDYFKTLEDNNYNSEKIKHVNIEELRALDFSDCSVSALSSYGEKILEHLSEENRTGFIECLTDTETVFEERETRSINGGCMGYRVILNTGEQIFVDIRGELLIINGEYTYLRVKGSIERLKEYWRDADSRFDSIANNYGVNDGTEAQETDHLDYFQYLEVNEYNLEKIKHVNVEELRALDFTDCSIAVLTPYGDRIMGCLSEENRVGFIECITDTETVFEERENCNFNGGRMGYRITLNTGDQIYIDAAYVLGVEYELMIINGEYSYVCVKGSLERLDEYWQDAHDSITANS